MRSLSGTLVAAILSRLRQPAVRLRADWQTPLTGRSASNLTAVYKDLGPVLQSVTVDRSIQTDLPPEAGRPSGGAAAELRATLVGKYPDQSRVASVLSPYVSHSPQITNRVGAPIVLDLGMVTSAGTELAQVFAGNVRDLDLNADGTVGLSALDQREWLTSTVTLPVFPATIPDGGDRAPGLRVGWVLDYVLRANRIWRAPPQRGNLVYCASNYGSAYPNVGGRLRFALRQDASSGRQGGITFAFDAAAHGWCLIDASTTLSSYVEATMTTVLGNALPQLNTPAAGTNGSVVEVDAYSTSLPASGTYEIAALFSTVGDTVSFQVTPAGALRCVVTRNGSTATSADIGTGAIVAGTKAYVLLSLDIATTGNATFRARVGGTTYTSAAFALAGTATGRASLSLIRYPVQVAQTATLGQVQATSETWTQASATLYNDDTLVSLGGTWRAAVLEQDQGGLVGTPAVEAADAWTLLVELASAEFGAVLFDEDGIFRFYSRSHMSGGASVATLTSDTHLRGLSSQEGIDGVRNQIKVNAVPLAPYTKTDLETLWVHSEVISLAAGASVTLFASPGFPIYDLDAAGAGVVTGPGNSQSDGLGADGTLNSTLTVFPDRAIITVTNPTGGTLWLVKGTTYPADEKGQPSVSLVGRSLRTPEQWAAVSIGAGTGSSSRADDITSQTAWGVQPLDLPDNRWRQNNAETDALAAYLLSRMKDPHPLLAGVPIVADLRLQLADRVTVQEPEVLGVSADFWVVGLTTTYDQSGLSQTATLRQV